MEFDEQIRNIYEEFSVLKGNKKFIGVKAYLHSSAVPLKEANLDPNKDQMDMFNDICDEGMCGV